MIVIAKSNLYSMRFSARRKMLKIDDIDRIVFNFTVCQPYKMESLLKDISIILNDLFTSGKCS